MTNDRNKENRDVAGNSHTKFHGKWLIVAAVAISIVTAAAVYSSVLTTGTATQAQAQNASLGEYLRSISPINVQATVVKDKLTSVDGVLLSEVAKNTKSLTTESVNGTIRSVLNDGQAEVVILRGTNIATGDNTMAFRLTNTGKESFKIVTLGMEGQTKSGFSPMKVLAISEKNFDKPNVTIRDAVLLNPGESMTGYFTGNWKVAEINEEIAEFRVGAVYRYENTDGSVKVWSISTDLYSLS